MIYEHTQECQLAGRPERYGVGRCAAGYSFPTTAELVAKGPQNWVANIGVKTLYFASHGALSAKRKSF